MTNNGLTARQSRALTAMMTSQSVVEAAKTAGVSERTLQRWLDDPAFRKELSERQSEAVTTVTRRLVTLADQAVNTINEVLTDPDIPAATRLRAAESVLSNLLKLRELVDLEARVARLESGIK